MNDNQYKLVLGGGCFWCLEAIYSQISGCKSVSPGYTGGKTLNPSYQQVCTGDTGHAEVIQIIYNPAVVDFSSLLDVFFATHDATTLDRQGNDVGTQYRSIICYSNNDEKELIEQKINSEQTQSKSSIVTQVEPLGEFYPAEIEHHDYYEQNANQPYCQMIIKPKLDKFIQWKESQ